MDEFSEWLSVERGLAPRSVRVYALAVEAALKLKNPLLRLSDPDLAPKSKHVIKSALVAWARFNKDNELESRLKTVRLPPAQRVKDKTPFSSAELRQFARELDTADYVSDSIRAVIGIMLKRGLRIGDVFRLKRTEIIASLKSGSLWALGKGGKRISFRTTTFEKFLRLLPLKDTTWDQVQDLIAPNYKTAHRHVDGGIKAIAEAAGMDYTEAHAHRLRRTVAVEFAKRVGGDLEKLRQFMGWSSVLVAAQYVDHKRDELEDIWEE